MNDLIKRAFEVHDALRECAASEVVDECVECVYCENGCVDGLMLDAATDISSHET